MMNSKGFTLIEIIVAVALVAILSAAVAPSVLNNIAQGRVSRTQSDVQAIASSVMRLKSDTGKYPRLDKPAYPDTVGMAFDFLASGAGNFPLGSTAGVWPQAFLVGVVSASTQSLGNHLILGVSDNAASTEDSYVRATNPDDPTDIGFRMGYISADQPDPWGNKYLVNVKALGQSGRTVWAISAGPNGVVETAVLANGTGAAATTAGDDIGFRIQ